MRRLLGATLIIAIAFAIRFGELFSPAPAPPAVSTTEPPSVLAVRRPTPVTARAPVPASFMRAPLEFLSTAPLDSLVLLPGIGPVIAERLSSARSDRRSFTRWEDLLEVKGIGHKKLDQLRHLAGDAD